MQRVSQKGARVGQRAAVSQSAQQTIMARGTPDEIDKMYMSVAFEQLPSVLFALKFFQA